MAVPRFYKFVRRFDQDVQRCRGGFVTPWHVCATFGHGCNPAVYVFLYMLPISMFSKQKYNI